MHRMPLLIDLQKGDTMSVRKLTTLALFTTLAIAIYAVESALPTLIPIPGIKPGLANIITLTVLHRHGRSQALWVLLTRIFLCSILFGQAMSLLYSLAGGLCCLLIMSLVSSFLQRRFLFITSIMGALAHNGAQLAVAYIITRVPGVLAYLPFLIISGIITGLFTGLCAGQLMKYLPRSEAQ